MKAKIKKTGEIINIEYAQIALEKCDSYGNPISISLEDVELIPDVKEDNFPNIDLEQKRYELAKAAMVAMIGSEKVHIREVTADRVVGLANNIIAELKRISKREIEQ